MSTLSRLTRLTGGPARSRHVAPRSRDTLTPRSPPPIRCVESRGIDPQHAIAAARFGRRGERLAAIGRVAERASHVDARFVGRIDANPAGRHRPRIPVAHQRPGRALVLGPIDARLALFVGAEGVVAHALFDRRVDDARIGAADRDADPSLVARRQAVGQLRPRVAGIDRLVETAAGAAAVEAPRAAPALIGGRVHHLRIGRIDRDVGDAGVVVDEEHVAPRLAAVDRLEEAALAVRAPQVPERRDEDDLRVGGMKRDAGDVPRVAQPEMIPGAAAIGRLVDAVAPGRVLLVARLARAHPDDLGIRLEHRDGADGVHALAIEERLEGGPAVGRLPDSAARARDVEGGRRRFDHGEIGDAAAERRRTNLTEGQPAQQIGRHERARLRRRSRRADGLPRELADRDDEQAERREEARNRSGHCAGRSSRQSRIVPRANGRTGRRGPVQNWRVTANRMPGEALRRPWSMSQRSASPDTLSVLPASGGRTP